MESQFTAAIIAEDIECASLAADARRFERFIEYEPNSGCWLWTGSLNEWGYGNFRSRGAVHLAHRASWVAQRGEILGGLLVLHRCDTPACVNPAHLWLGTNKDNMDDKVSKGRARGGRLAGEAHPRARLTEADIRQIRASWPDLSLNALGAAYGIAKSTVSAIVNRHRWPHVE